MSTAAKRILQARVENPQLLTVWPNPKKGSRRKSSRYPFRNGQDISIEQFEAWLRTQPSKVKAAYRKAMKDYAKFHIGAKPTSVAFQMIDIGGPQVLDPEIMFSAGEGPTETYTPEKHSGKAPHSYVHEYKSKPPVIIGGKKGRQFVLKPLTGSARVDDWFRG